MRAQRPQAIAHSCTFMFMFRKTKIGTEVAHVTPDSDTTFKVNRLKVNLQTCRGAALAAVCTVDCAIEIVLITLQRPPAQFV